MDTYSNLFTWSQDEATIIHGYKDKNGKTVSDICIHPQLLELVRFLAKDETFYKKWRKGQGFKIVSGWRPSTVDDLVKRNISRNSKDKYYYPGSTQAELVAKGGKYPVAAAGKSAHNQTPSKAFDFSINSANENTRWECWSYINSVAKKLGISIHKVPNDPIHVAIPMGTSIKAGNIDLSSGSKIRDLLVRNGITNVVKWPDIKVSPDMKPSVQILALIRYLENPILFNAIAKNPTLSSWPTYQDVNGQIDMGWGLLTTKYKNKESVPIAVIEAEFAIVIKDRVAKIYKRLSELGITDIAQNKFDALIELYYNIIPGSITDFTLNTLPKVNKNDDAVASKILEYTGGNGGLSALIRRRAYDYAIYAYGIYRCDIPINIFFPADVLGNINVWYQKHFEKDKNGNKADINSVKAFYNSIENINTNSGSGSSPQADQPASSDNVLPKKYFYDFSTNTDEVKYVRFGRSTFTGKEHSRYIKSNITMLDVLKEAEYRSPGSYFDVLDDGMFATLFFGRPNYYVDKTDPLHQKQKLSSEAEDFINLSLTRTNTDGEYKGFSFDSYGGFNKAAIVNLLADRVKPFSDSGIEGMSDLDPPSVKDKEKRYEKASNVVFAVTGKNLVSNNLIVNNGVSNAVTVDYNPSIWQKISDLAKTSHFISKATVCAFPTLVDFEDRLREKLIIDDNIRTFSQAVEVGQSVLQRELEKYYDGSIIILFNPEIKYRTELLIYDTINDMYGTVIVREFEHKFDGRGAYTIIKPGMKIEQTGITKNIIRGFWSKIFENNITLSGDGTKIKEFQDLAGKLNAYSQGKDYLGVPTAEELTNIMNLYNNESPIMFGDYAVKQYHDDHDDKTSVLRSSFGCAPFKAHPIASKTKLLMPDADIYNFASSAFSTKFKAWFSEFGNKFHDFFSANSSKRVATNINLWKAIGNSISSRLITTFKPNQAYYDSISKNGVFISKIANDAVFNAVKETMLDNDYYESKSSSVSIPKNLAIGFMNCKILRTRKNKSDVYLDLNRIHNICDIISRFDAFTTVEIAADTLTDAKALYSYMVSKINSSLKSENVTFQTDSTNRVFLGRVKGMVVGNKPVSVDVDGKKKTYYFTDRADEYYFVFHRTTVTASCEVANHSTLIQLDSNLKEKSYSVNPVYAAFTKGTKSAKCVFFHNIYEPFTFISGGKNIVAYEDPNLESYLESEIAYGRKTYGAPQINAAGRVQIIKDIISLSKTKNIEFIFGDFNMNIVDVENTSALYRYEPSYTVILSNIKRNNDNLSYIHTDDFSSIIGPTVRTTVTADEQKNAYDKILAHKNAKDKIIDYGALTEYLGSDFKSYVTDYSDHLPIFLTVGDKKYKY